MSRDTDQRRRKVCELAACEEEEPPNINFSLARKSRNDTQSADSARLPDSQISPPKLIRLSLAAASSRVGLLRINRIPLLAHKVAVLRLVLDARHQPRLSISCYCADWLADGLHSRDGLATPQVKVLCRCISFRLRLSSQARALRWQAIKSSLARQMLELESLIQTFGPKQTSS